jgi:hypothetical protein
LEPGRGSLDPQPVRMGGEVRHLEARAETLV